MFWIDVIFREKKIVFKYHRQTEIFECNYMKQERETQFAAHILTWAKRFTRSSPKKRGRAIYVSLHFVMVASAYVGAVSLPYFPYTTVWQHRNAYRQFIRESWNQSNRHLNRFGTFQMRYLKWHSVGWTLKSHFAISQFSKIAAYNSIDRAHCWLFSAIL